jgi:hypothetical protein
MGQEEVLEAFGPRVKAAKSNAQLVIGVTPSKTLEEAKEIIERIGVSIVKTKYLSLDVVLLKLDIGDMRGAALKLTENGFFNIAGINAINLKTEKL